MKTVNKARRVQIKSAVPGTAQKIDIATQTLERNIDFINSCDTKTSIVLALVGVLMTIILTNDGLATIYGVICNSIAGKTFCDVLYLLAVAASVCKLVFGIWKLISVLVAKVDPITKGRKQDQNPSMIFFGGILSNGGIDAYRKKFASMKDTELLDDLISEIYVNAEIATRKYKRYNIGLKCSVLGFAFFIVLLLVGVYIYQ